MSDQPPDPLAILRTLGIADVGAVAPVAGGWDTLLWRVEHGGAVSALRLFRPEQAAACRNEVTALAAARRGGVPVPDVRAEGIWQGRPALLLSWCPGQTVAAALRATPWRAWSLGLAFGRTQARIHLIAAPADLRETARSWIDWAEPGARLRDRLAAARLRDDALLHLDYHPLNVLVDRNRVTCVLDWANATFGDPRADLARAVAILRLAPPPPGTSPLARLVGLRVFERGWRRGYSRIAPFPDDMGPFCAWAGLVILRDLAPKLGRPGVWLRPRDLDAVRRWIARWGGDD